MSYSTQAMMPWNEESVTVTSIRPNSSNSVEVVTNAGVSPLSQSEISASNGVYVSGDLKFEFSTSAPAFTLKPRDTIAWGGDTYTVMTAAREPWLEFVQVVARNPILAADLRQTATVYRPVPTTDDYGMRVANLASVYTSQPCRLQPVSRTQEFDVIAGEATRAVFTCVFLNSVVLYAGDVIEVSSVRYEVTGYTGVEALGELIEVNCTRLVTA